MTKGLSYRALLLHTELEDQKADQEVTSEHPEEDGAHDGTNVRALLARAATGWCRGAEASTARGQDDEPMQDGDQIGGLVYVVEKHTKKHQNKTIWEP
jgi:hypothetical protein